MTHPATVTVPAPPMAASYAPNGGLPEATSVVPVKARALETFEKKLRGPAAQTCGVAGSRSHEEAMPRAIAVPSGLTP